MDAPRPSSPHPPDQVRAPIIAQAASLVFALRAVLPVAMWVVLGPGGLGPALDATLAAALVVNAVLCLVARTWPTCRWWLGLDAAVNLVLTTAIVHLTGGPTSPLLVAYLLQAAVYLVVFGGLPAGCFLVGSGILLGLLTAARLPGLAAMLPPPLPLDPRASAGIAMILLGAPAFAILPLTRRLWELQLALSARVAETQEALAFQLPLADLALALQSTRSLGEIATLICQRCRALLDVDGAFLWLGDEDLAGMAGDAADGIDVAAVLASPPTVMKPRVLRYLGHCAIDDVAQSQYAEHPLLKQVGAGSLLIVPLRGQWMPLGMLVLTDGRTGRFEETLQRRAKVLAAQAAAAVESAILVERIAESADRVTALVMLSENLGRSQDLSEVVATVGEAARDLIPCEHAVVLLWDGEKDALVFAGRVGEAAAFLSGIDSAEWPKRGVALAERLAHGKTVVFSGPETPRLLSAAVTSESAGTIIAVPMFTKAGMQGAMLLGRREEQEGWTASHQQMVEGIARQAAIAIENARLVDNLRQANRLKSEFVGTMSHELRTPIHIILGYVEMLADGALGPLGDEQVGTLGRVRDRSLSLLELVNATLDLNRLDSGRAPISLSKFTLPEVFRELEAETSAIPRKPGVALRFETPQDITPVVSDRSKLKTIVKNLVGNAVKFTDKGSVTVRVTARPSTGVVALEVEDTGVGIKPEDQGLIFEMFRQADSGDARKFDGVGLGLYIVKRLCEQLGGEIALESVYRRGATFRVRIPVSLDGAVAGETAAPAPPRAAAPRSAYAVNG